MQRPANNSSSGPIAHWPARYINMIPVDMGPGVLIGIPSRYTACSRYVVQASCSLVALTIAARITSKCTSVTAISPKQHSMLPNSANLNIARFRRKSRPGGRWLISVFIIFQMATPCHHLVSISCDSSSNCQGKCH